jgi:hypothetical protein
MDDSHVPTNSPFLDFFRNYFLLSNTLKMPLGILEYHRLEHVPGTAPLGKVQTEGISEAGLGTNIALKYDKSGTIVLVPQPSDDPNDPLNWPRWRKEMFIFSAIWGTACVGGTSSLLSSQSPTDF